MCSGARSASTPPPARRRNRTSIRVARHERSRIGQPVAARECRLFDADEVQGAALPRQTHSGVAILRVDAAHPHQRTGRHHGERVPDLHSACTCGTRRHRSASRQSEHAIDRQTKQAIFGAPRPSRPQSHANARAVRRRRDQREPLRRGETAAHRRAPWVPAASRSAPSRHGCAPHPPDRFSSRRRRRG